MSCTNVTITVIWTAPGAGEVHNMTIGYREQGSGLPYTTIPATSLGGAPGSQDIIVPCATCDGVVYEGYVQDDCGSPQVPWTAVVFPEGSDCFEYEWCCVASPLESIDIINAGDNYVVGDLLQFVGGAPTSTAVGTVLTVGATGDILTFDILSPGAGYTSVPAVTVIRNIPVAGTEAVLTANLDTCVPLQYEYCHPGDPPVVGNVELQHGECYKECTTEIIYDTKVQTMTDAGAIDQFTHGVTGIDCDCDNHCKEVEIINDSGDAIQVYWQTCDSGGGVDPGTSYLENIGNGVTWVSGQCILCDTIHVVGNYSAPDVIINCTPCL
jgi:hypothetical protein